MVLRIGCGNPSPPDARDWGIGDLADPTITLPPSVLPAGPWTVLDQDDTPECVGYSGALNQQIHVFLEDAADAVFSGPDLYAQAKLRDGDPDDPGTTIRAALQALTSVGALVITDVTGALAPGQRVKVGAYARLSSINDIKVAIATPTLASAWMLSNWYNPWFNPTKSGLLPPPTGTSIGGHGYEFIGYDDSRKAFLLQNSWGPTWGLSGRAWFPYSYVTSAISWEGWTTVAAPLPAPPYTPRSGMNFTAIEPVRIVDTRVKIGLPAALPRNVPQKVQVGGVAGIPANATAISGNLTVVTPAKPGLVTVDPTSRTPATSTINFVNVTLANSFLSGLSPDGTLFLTASTPVQVLLDVTGFFTP
jgi:hypothetical protein